MQYRIGTPPRSELLPAKPGKATLQVLLFSNFSLAIRPLANLFLKHRNSIPILLLSNSNNVIAFGEIIHP